MVFTIARTAAKRARWLWQTPVTAEPKSIRMQIDADARLAAAAGGAARYFGDAAGLTGAAAADFQRAIIAACEEAFEHLTREPSHLDVSFTRLRDRIEITLTHEGDADPVVGLDAIAGFAKGRAADASRGEFSMFQGIDRVQFENSGGIAVTRLTKYIVGTARTT